MNTKALFPCGGGSNLILGTGTENQTFILRTPYLSLKLSLTLPRREKCFGAHILGISLNQ